MEGGSLKYFKDIKKKKRKAEIVGVDGSRFMFAVGVHATVVLGFAVI